MHTTKYDCLALFSGGLDSILACKVIQSQGLSPLGLHFVSPFFGHESSVPAWTEMYGVDILPVDISREFVHMLTTGPQWGVGKSLNPCIDCKILMLRKARSMLPMFQASFLISGEVLGQRPMSQRRDALNIIRREAGVQDILVRPLSGRLLPPTAAEESGLVDRERLLQLKGRGRKEQLALAQEYGLPEIPTPGGGCLLTDQEHVKRFWPVFKHLPSPQVADFTLATLGRQYWADGHWLVIGRNKTDNERLAAMSQAGDLLFKTVSVPGPVALGRQTHAPWSQAMIQDAARFMSTFANKAVQSQERVLIRVGSFEQETRKVWVHPTDPAQAVWEEPSRESFEQEKKLRHTLVDKQASD